MTPTSDSPGALIADAMRRRGYSAYVVADLTGDVSPTTVRNYIRLKTPGRGYRLGNLCKVAQALDQDGPRILDAFGERVAADRLRAELASSRERPKVSYEGPVLTAEEAAAVRLFIRALQHSRSELAAAVGVTDRAACPTSPPTVNGARRRRGVLAKSA